MEKYYSTQFNNGFWQFIIDNPDKDWVWLYLAEHPTITWEIIQNNPDKKWNWDGISRNPNITWEIIQNNPDKDWDWGGLSFNPEITFEIIQNNPNYPWDCKVIFSSNIINIKNKKIYIKKNIQIDIKRRLGKKILPHIFNDEDIIEYILEKID